ncbi:hypothetical protein [Pseudomonas sp. QTF5]|uniref:hypothetical protein n=1 Tax=Pseudomonas sp. QTF5 TaxID=1435425 RepID=UPI0004B49513|nr:hypothetical protein [Pseudomonas sp. QTF5]
MIGSNYRLAITQFIPIDSNSQPHSAQLTEKKDKRDFIEMSQVRGQSNSNIEKMTHPLTQPDDIDHLSPYMIDLVGKTTTLAFAEKVLQAPRKRLLDKLGIDDTQEKQRQARLKSAHTTISRFYNQAQPIPLTLNGSPFLEQEPTNPYFIEQKIITPDFRMYRHNENAQALDLLHCKLRDDSEIAFNKAPIEKLQQYNNSIYLNESRLRENGKNSNKAEYFVEMVDYLIQRAKPGDFIVQNSLESSSDKNTPHFQYIPNQVPLPIFFHTPHYNDKSNTQIVDWHLPALCKKIDLQQSDWKDKTHQLQDLCQELLNTQHISTTPLFRKLENDLIESYLIFKKDCSSTWNITPEDIQNAPGWLEACGIFVANSPKAEVFSSKGAEKYYATFSVTTESIRYFFETSTGTNIELKKTSPSPT